MASEGFPETGHGHEHITNFFRIYEIRRDKVRILTKTRFMKHQIYAILFLSALILSFSGCGLSDAAKKGEKAAGLFHKHMKMGNENAMLDLIHEDLMEAEGPKVKKLIHSIANELKVKEVKKETGFNTNINNGVATVSLTYSVVLENGDVLSERMVLKDSKDGTMKVSGLNYQQ